MNVFLQKFENIKKLYLRLLIFYQFFDENCQFFGIIKIIRTCGSLILK